MELKRQGERLHCVQGGEREVRAALVSSGDLHTEAKDHFPLSEETKRFKGRGDLFLGLRCVKEIKTKERS